MLARHYKREKEYGYSYTKQLSSQANRGLLTFISNSKVSDSLHNFSLTFYLAISIFHGHLIFQSLEIFSYFSK